MDFGQGKNTKRFTGTYDFIGIIYINAILTHAHTHIYIVLNTLQDIIISVLYTLYIMYSEYQQYAAMKMDGGCYLLNKSNS